MYFIMSLTILFCKFEMEDYVLRKFVISLWKDLFRNHEWKHCINNIEMKYGEWWNILLLDNCMIMIEIAKIQPLASFEHPQQYAAQVMKGRKSFCKQ